MRYIVLVFMLVMSLIGSVFCANSAMNTSSALIYVIAAIGVVAWLVIIYACLCAIAKGRSM
jgi:hypothetical protein